MTEDHIPMFMQVINLHMKLWEFQNSFTIIRGF